MARKQKGVRMNLLTLPPLDEAGRAFRDPLILTALMVTFFAVLSKHGDGALLKLIGGFLLILSVGLFVLFLRKWNAFRTETDVLLVRDYGSESCHYRQKERQWEKGRKRLSRAHALDEQRDKAKRYAEDRREVRNK